MKIDVQRNSNIEKGNHYFFLKHVFITAVLLTRSSFIANDYYSVTFVLNDRTGFEIACEFDTFLEPNSIEIADSAVTTCFDVDVGNGTHQSRTIGACAV